jgi:hypothetical protein
MVGTKHPADIGLIEPFRFRKETMKAQVGERYRCSDASCGCEIEVISPGRMQNESYRAGSANTGSQARPSNERPVGGSATEESEVGSLRNAESGSISTPGDFGSQGATGEGVFCTSGGNQRSTMSGRLGSTTGSSLKSGSRSSGSSSTSNIETGSTFLLCLRTAHAKSSIPSRRKDVIRIPQKTHSHSKEKGESIKWLAFCFSIRLLADSELASLD